MKNRDGVIIVDTNDDGPAAEALRRLADLAGVRSGGLGVVHLDRQTEDVQQRLRDESVQFILGDVAAVAPAPVAPSAKRPPAHWSGPRAVPNQPGVTAWKYAGLLVLSELGNVEAPDASGDILATWLISVSKGGNRPSDRDVSRALEAFGMVGAEEDNHGPGIARHFFLVVDPTRRVDCECKSDETVVTEPDGYRWSTPKDGPCAGCEYTAITGKPCPVHGPGGAP